MRFAPCTQRWGEAAPVALLARARGGLTHHFVATRFPHLSQVDDETFDLVHGLFEWDTPEESARSTKLFSLTMLSLMSGKVSTLEDEIGLAFEARRRASRDVDAAVVGPRVV